jgi:dihydroorotase-like cyclic amidohydrolase
MDEKKEGKKISRRGFMKKSALVGAGSLLAANELIKRADIANAEEFWRFTTGYWDGLPSMVRVKNDRLVDNNKTANFTGRMILKGGHVVDPRNGRDGTMDVSIVGDRIEACAKSIKPQPGDKVMGVDRYYVFPGLIDMHNHIADLWDNWNRCAEDTVASGGTMSFSPGAGNTLIGPSLIMADWDRAAPMHVSQYIGVLNMCGTRANTGELIRFFRGKMPLKEATQKIARNTITCFTAPMAVGIKEHQNHWITPADTLEKAYEVTSKANLLFMSHCQDPNYSEYIVNGSKGRPIHLGHMTASGHGTHGDPVESAKAVCNLLRKKNVTGEFVSSQLRKHGGCREGFYNNPETQKVYYNALREGLCKVIISDGMATTVMKGFGDPRDNIGCLFELADMGVLTLSEAVACMTSNVTELFAERHQNNWWTRELGHLGPGAYANITVADRRSNYCIFTIVNGVISAVEQRMVRSANGGQWVSKWGLTPNTGVGDLTLFGHAPGTFKA